MKILPLSKGQWRDDDEKMGGLLYVDACFMPFVQR